jgi:peptidyl-prolyl cis-trans isomerase C
VKRTGRALLLVPVAAAGLALSSCSSVPAQAATINGTDISRADFERDLRALAANPSLLNITGATERTIEGATARVWLTQLLTWQAAEDVLAEHGIDPAPDALDGVKQQLESSDAAQNLPQGMKDEVIQGAASVSTLPLVSAPTADDLEQVYTDDPAATGTVCARHIVVDTEADARDVLDQLDGGADFAELAKERSIEPAAKDTGGALTASNGNACVPIGDYQSQYDPDFVAGALAAEVGVPTEPVKSQFGWHVILLRPFDEVGEDMASLVSTSPGDAALTGALATADITVDQRYGEWSPARGKVVSLVNPDE